LWPIIRDWRQSAVSFSVSIPVYPCISVFIRGSFPSSASWLLGGSIQSVPRTP
jgi:hypothetical protein